MNNRYRFDYVFSYWIFCWFIFYFYKLTSFSPLFALIIGIIENSFLYYIRISKHDLIYRIEFLIVNFFLKILPLYYIIVIQSNAKIKINDILATIILFIIYSLWIIINKQIYIKNNKLIVNTQSATPIYNILKDLRIIQ
jgi:hypothetical protein